MPQRDDSQAFSSEHARDMPADESVGAGYQHRSAHRGLRVPAKLYSRPGNFRKPPRMPSTKSGITPGSGNQKRAAIRRFKPARVSGYRLISDWSGFSTRLSRMPADSMA